MQRIVLLGLLVTLGFADNADATSSDTVEATCPVCSNKFKARSWRSTNSMGGKDRDFCGHARGGQVFLFSCWTCPRCKYTGFKAAFKVKGASKYERIPAELVARLKKNNPLKAAIEIDPALENTEKIPAWVRYDLYYQVLALNEDAKPEDLAWVRLRTAWTQRFDAMRLVPKRLNMVVQSVYKKHKADLPEDDYGIVVGLARILAQKEGVQRLLAATLYLYRGEGPDAERMLTALEKEKDLPEDVTEAIAALRKAMEIEQRYYRLAIPLFEKGLTETKQRDGVRYLIAELHRKTGEPDKAAKRLEVLLAEEGLRKELRPWVKDALEKTRR